jgi:hypothetical protein
MCFIFYFINNLSLIFKDTGIDGQTFMWLDPNDFKLIFSKIGDQLKIKAMITKFSNCEIVVEKNKNIIDKLADDIQYIDESAPDNLNIDEINRSSESESDNDDDNTENKDSEEIQLIDKLPRFSNNIENELQKGSLWADKKIRCQLINEMSVYFSAEKSFKLKNSKQYKQIGIKLLQSYPLFRQDIEKICDLENMIIAMRIQQNLGKKSYYNHGLVDI